VKAQSLASGNYVFIFLFFLRFRYLQPPGDIELYPGPPSASALHATLESPTVTIQFSALDATNGSISSLQIDPHTRMTARNGPVAVL